MRIRGGELHRDGAAGFRADDVRGLQPDRVEKIYNHLGEIGKRPFEIRGRGRTAVAGKIGPEEPVLLRHARHPSEPNVSVFQIPVQKDDGFGGIDPRSAQPIFPVEHPQIGSHGNDGASTRSAIHRLRLAG